MSTRVASTRETDPPGVLVDAHAHVGAAPAAGWEAAAPGVVVFYNSTGMDDLPSTFEFAMSDRSLSALFAGLHPTNPRHDLGLFTGWFESHASDVDGVGEIGLDQRIPLEESRKEFVSQLELASRWKKPVSVHTRGRLRNALDDLSGFDLKVLLHWFQGSEQELEESMERGYFVSFGPPVLYSKKMERLLVATRMDRLLLETDSPVRYGACFESRESWPTMIASVYFRAAGLKEVGIRDFERSIEENASSYLGRPFSAPPR
jgi:TatD DNase family protein